MGHPTATKTLVKWLSGITFEGVEVRTTVPADALDQLIEWRLSDPRFRRVNGTTGTPNVKGENVTQRQFFVEVKADFADEGKYRLINEAVIEMAELLWAKLDLIPIDNGPKPQVVAHSVDFFHGNKAIELRAAPKPITNSLTAAAEAMFKKE
jgi:hypothetical protein